MMSEEKKWVVYADLEPVKKDLLVNPRVVVANSTSKEMEWLRIRPSEDTWIKEALDMRHLPTSILQAIPEVPIDDCMFEIGLKKVKLYKTIGQTRVEAFLDEKVVQNEKSSKPFVFPTSVKPHRPWILAAVKPTTKVTTAAAAMSVASLTQQESLKEEEYDPVHNFALGGRVEDPEDDGDEEYDPKQAVSDFQKVFTAEETQKKQVETELNQRRKKKSSVFLEPLIPVSIMKSDIARIHHSSSMYAFASKTNGVRFMFIVKRVYGQLVSFFVNRADQIFVWPYPCLPEIWENTVLDGEMIILNSGEPCFMVYDCWQSMDKIVGQHGYLVRLQVAQHLIATLEDARLGPLSVRVKPVYRANQISILLQAIQNADHDTDGLILTRVESPALAMTRSNQLHPLRLTGKTYSIMKWKPVEEHTIDCFFVQYPNTPHPTLQVLKDSKIVDFYINGVLQTVDIPPGRTWKPWVVYEVRYEKKTKIWTAVRSRKDKCVPNALSTALKTYQNICDSLTILDLFPLGSLSDIHRQMLAQSLGLALPAPLKTPTVYVSGLYDQKPWAPVSIKDMSLF
jgi:hypothetical protein